MSVSKLRLDANELQVDAFEPAPEPPTGGPDYYMKPGPTDGESTCIQYSCNACTFTCWAC